MSKKISKEELAKLPVEARIRVMKAMKKMKKRESEENEKPKGLGEFEKLYFSNLNKEQIKAIQNFLNDIKKTAEHKVNEMLQPFQERLNKLAESIGKTLTISGGDEFMSKKIGEISVKEMNIMGEKEGWRFAFALDDRLYFCRTIILKEKK